MPGQSEDGIVCVRFGLVTSDTDVEELVSLVYGTGREVEESSKVRWMFCVFGNHRNSLL